MIDFRTEPAKYRHWRLDFDGPVAHLLMDVDPAGGLFDGYELKLNSYDLGVDIELHDAVQRLRFEHPEVRAVVLSSGRPGVFCAGANIRMLGKASHGHKVNFCKFTNETRMAIEDATECSGQFYLAAVSGVCAGGGYEIAMTAGHIMLIDDRRSAVALPETPLLAVLPGTGGLTRLTDKRKVRRDRADQFCLLEEGIRGARAVEWRLVDEVVSPTAWQETVARRSAEFAARSDRPDKAVGVALTPLAREVSDDAMVYSQLRVSLERAGRRAVITLSGPTELPTDLLAIHAAGAAFWPLAMARELDDALLHLRLNEPTLGLLVLRTQGDLGAVLAMDALLDKYHADWFVREVRLFLKRVLKRLDLTSRSLVTLIEAGSCFAGTLAELAFAADRAVMASEEAQIAVSALNFGAYPMSNRLTRLETRFLGEPKSVRAAQGVIGERLDSVAAEGSGLVTAAFDQIDWEDEVRLMLEERVSFSPDALTAMEANLRFAGPETMETRIFGRLTAWQNWVFQRPNAVGVKGALQRYGSGQRAEFDPDRV
jgi:benzoyl-CoA-dihydrodiol lyase